MGSSSAPWSEPGMAGAEPANAMDNLAPAPSAPKASTVSAAPVVDAGNVHATPQAEAALVYALSVARAVKQIAPQPVMRNNRIDVEHAAAAARKELGVDGPPGTARKPATATNMTAMTHSVTKRIGSGWARRMTIAPAAAAVAMPPPVMTSAAPWVTTPDQSNAAAPSTAVHRHAAIAANRAGTRSASTVSIAVCHASLRVHCSTGAGAVVSNNSSPSRIALS